MIKLYGGTFSRAAIVKWYLEELQIPYEFVLVDLKTGAHLQPEYLAINPFGKVPALAVSGLADGDFVLWESGAILTYLASKYDPAINTPEKLAIVNQWVLFANSTLANGLFTPEFQAKETPHLLGQLDALLSQRDYLLGGDQLSAADVAVASLLSYVGMMLKDFDPSPYPHVVAYLDRMKGRSAFQASMTSPG
jgi:glutathione S-transferase